MARFPTEARFPTQGAIFVLPPACALGWDQPNCPLGLPVLFHNSLSQPSTLQICCTITSIRLVQQGFAGWWELHCKTPEEHQVGEHFSEGKPQPLLLSYVCPPLLSTNANTQTFSILWVPNSLFLESFYPFQKAAFTKAVSALYSYIQ